MITAGLRRTGDAVQHVPSGEASLRESKRALASSSLSPATAKPGLPANVTITTAAATLDRKLKSRSETLPGAAVVMGFEATLHSSYANNLEQCATVFAGSGETSTGNLLLFPPLGRAPLPSAQNDFGRMKV